MECRLSRSYDGDDDDDENGVDGDGVDDAARLATGSSMRKGKMRGRKKLLECCCSWPYCCCGSETWKGEGNRINGLMNNWR